MGTNDIGQWERRLSCTSLTHVQFLAPHIVPRNLLKWFCAKPGVRNYCYLLCPNCPPVTRTNDLHFSCFWIIQCSRILQRQLGLLWNGDSGRADSHIPMGASKRKHPVVLPPAPLGEREMSAYKDQYLACHNGAPPPTHPIGHLLFSHIGHILRLDYCTYT